MLTKLPARFDCLIPDKPERVRYMTRSPRSWPLFNRIEVLVGSSTIAICITFAVVQGFRKGNLDGVTLFLNFVFFAMACAGIWFSLLWKNRTQEELAEEQSISTIDQPDISETALVYRFSNGLKSAAIYIDAIHGKIHFHNCHTPRRFLSTASELFSCPIDELKAAHVWRHDGESLTIVTSQGKALMPDAGPGYGEVRDAIQELVPFTHPGFSADHPMMNMVFIMGAVIGLFTGVLLVPSNSSDAVLGLFVLFGAVLGCVGIYGLVWAGDRLLRTGFVQPIGYAVVGGIAGLLVAGLFQPWIGWQLTPMIVLVLVGVVAGGMFGIQKQSREGRPSETAVGTGKRRHNR